jgi:DNA-binding transcriptional LysR family regulator
LKLTDDGERMQPRFLQLLGEFDELLHAGGARIEGLLRVQAPVTVTAAFLGSVVTAFHERNSELNVEVILTDRSPNPFDEASDVILTAQPVSFLNVVEIPLSPYPIVLCGAPGYLRARGTPAHPHDLIEHACLTTGLLPSLWIFDGERGTISVEIRPHFQSNDGSLVADAARNGLGVAMVPRFLVEQDFRDGNLVPLLTQFPVPEYWLKALVARYRMNRPAVREFVEFLKQEILRAPWRVSRENPERPARVGNVLQKI